MPNLLIQGGQPLNGTIRPHGNKNAALPTLCASLLTDELVVLDNIPHITDVEKLVSYFKDMGSKVYWDKGAKRIELSHRDFGKAGNAALPVGMRSSVLLFAPLLHRIGQVPLAVNAKGCALGVRELDPHIEIMHHFGAEMIQSASAIDLKIAKPMQGCRHWADYMSVTATENFVMAAVLAKGNSILLNAASEPHVQDVCRFLVQLGAKISGIGTSRIEIEGVDSLSSGAFQISSDFHEVVTFLALGAMTDGHVEVHDVQTEHFDLIIRSFAKLGVSVENDGETLSVFPGQTRVIQKPLTSNILPKIEAAPWPYFPVDLLPLMIALSVRAQGEVQFWNKVYENGFSWIPELTKFGAHVVTSDPHRIVVFGNRPLRPATVEAPYIIRAAVALYMVAATIEGESRVIHADPIRRAHPGFVENLQRLGAVVHWD
ncbi:MAG: UDP-N-acetylglucosamine 1-carboxyvinyltransferase [Opitutales bacterium]|nr:UDP-N-acetylglucosamine 1-carboxyvinyltransferase [Opitutales bacterium]